MPITRQGRSWFTNMLRERSFLVALALWVAASLSVFPLSGGKLPLNRPALANFSVAFQVIASTVALAFTLFQMTVVYFLTRRRTVPDMAGRSPDVAAARREVWLLWVYGALVLLAGRWIGLRLFGEGIGLHLNGSLFGMTRMVSPREVWVWAFYNFVFLAVVPYVIFRARGYSREALNLKSSNLKNDSLVIVVIMAMGIALDLSGGGFLKLSGHQMLAGGALTFITHLLGTGLPVMVFIYAILFPRYLKLTSSPVAAMLLGGASYAVLHVFEYWTLYDSLPHALLSIIFVLLTFVPPGLMKSYLTLRTANAWVHLWGYHAITPHVTADTPMVVKIFNIR
ncbi:MAG TPA: hypothetical protein VG051_03935 [Candidatus Acidoferrum sp.]|jgi:hypothetical protein|nr:hypothetical protein [Candidatus Acidoferrum sp.]